MNRKIEDMMKHRTEGMVFALKIAREKGIEGLEKEIAFRQRSGISLSVTEEELREMIDKIKKVSMDSVLILLVAALHDEEGWGEKRCKRIMKRMEQKSDCILEDYCSWQDYIDVVAEELNIHIVEEKTYEKEKN